jgi:hypothetical protein
MLNTDIIVAIITAVTTSILGPIAVHYAKELADKNKKKKDPLAESIKVNQMITEKLEDIKENIHSDRIWLLQFHNGGHFYPTGKSMQKFSMVYELLNPSVVPCQSQFQNIPVSLFSRAINHLSEGNTINIEDTDLEDQKFEGFTSVIFGAGVLSTYMFPIFNIKGDFVGIVGIDFVHQKIHLEEEKIKVIELEVTTIGGVLTNYLSS